MTKILSQFFVFLLMIDAAVVAVGLSRKKNMWHFVFLYWILLTVKNVIDFIGTI